MNHTIQSKVKQIAECVCGHVLQQQVGRLGGLYDGGFGILLFLIYYSKYSGDPKVFSLTDAYADQLIDQLGKEVRLHTFCSGLSGILYLFEFLREKQLMDIDVRDTEIILENYLVNAMRKDIQNWSYDFMHGALGVGLYFLKKGSSLQPVHEIIDFLDCMAEKDILSKVFKWKSVLHEKGSIDYNISLSHGISSIVLFLSRAMEKNVKDERLGMLLEGAVNYLLSQEIDIEQYGSHFPSYNISLDLSASRLAWCYGDLGIAFSLWYAGKVVNRTEWENKALEVLFYATQRVSPEEHGVYDAGICHGSAGISIIFRRMYLETKDERFLAAASHWLGQTLAYSLFDDGLAGYKTKLLNNWRCDYSFLTGVSGTGLTFISYLMNDQQDWDEMVLLS